MTRQGKRVLSIWLPRLPLDRLRRRNDPRILGPFAIIAQSRNVWKLTHPNDVAFRAGLTPGLSVPDARAICPDLLTEPGDPEREARFLYALRCWADRLSPRVALDPPDGLILDIAGCAHLFGGEAEMATHARQGLHDMQVEARAAIADTRKAAWALARYGSNPVGIALPGKTVESLLPLRVNALGLPSEMVTELRQLGIETIGQLHVIKSSELALRFGPGLIQDLARATGCVPDPIISHRRDPTYAAGITMPDPIGLVEDLVLGLERLADSVCRRLQAVQKGARRYHLTVRCVDTGDHRSTVGFARPVNDPVMLLQQFRHPLDELKIEFGADRLHLAADCVERIQARQRHLGEAGNRDGDITGIVSTLGNRLGFDRICRWLPVDSHLPEREFGFVEAAHCEMPPVWERNPRRRPIRLYKYPELLKTLEPDRPPRKFSWRCQTYETAHAEGPERLASEWWLNETLPQRDYWRVQTTTGLRLWLLTYPGLKRPDWYVAGRFP